MTIEELVPLLGNEVFQRELHRFLWTEPMLNKGTIDHGWSCRDHAVVIGQIALDANASVAALHGKCMFVQGAGAEGEPPVGLGQWPHDAGQHTWIHIEDVGHVDLSPKLAWEGAGWRPLPYAGILASAWSPPAAAGLVVTTDVAEYEQAIRSAAQARGRVHAIYYVETGESFTSDTARSGLSWANSPRTDELREFGLAEDIYIHLAKYLRDVARGDRVIRRTKTREQAWSELLERYVDGDPLRV